MRPPALIKAASKNCGPIIKGVSELDSVVRADRLAVPMNLLLVQSCITDLPEGRLAALCDYSDLGQPGVCIDVFNLEDEHLVHVLRIAWMSVIGGLKIRRAALLTSAQPRRVCAFGS